MAGILDSKSRILDTIVTLEGRRQIAAGDLKVRYVSFTDAATYYRADLISGSADATARIYLEQSHLPQDQITLEADDSGRLQPFKNGSGISVKDGQILAYTFSALTASILTGSSQGMRLLGGDEFASTAEMLLASSIDNFNRLRIIGTKDLLFEDDGFGVGTNRMTFNITNERPIPDATQHATHIDHLESLFNDIRLSKVTNFKYLPPINKLEDQRIDKQDHRQTAPYHLGHYKPWGRSHLFGLQPRQLEHELGHYHMMGYSKTVTFDPTSRDNTLFGQFFEVQFNVMKKMDVIDYGRYVYNGQAKHAFFVGKVMTDGNGSQTFVHIFTLIFG